MIAFQVHLKDLKPSAECFVPSPQVNLQSSRVSNERIEALQGNSDVENWEGISELAASDDLESDEVSEEDSKDLPNPSVPLEDNNWFNEHALPMGRELEW